MKHCLVVVIFLALTGSARSADEDFSIHIDHVMLGASNLERAVSDFEKATGVRPVFGGKHPGGRTQMHLYRWVAAPT